MDYTSDSNTKFKGTRKEEKRITRLISTHTAHTTHTAHSSHTTGRLVLLGRINDARFARGQKASNATSIDEGSPHDLEGVDDTRFDHVDVFALGSIVSPSEL